MNRFDGYELLTLREGFGLVRVASVSKLRLIDAVLFDCDGVLVDSRESYDRAIELTVLHFLSRMLGLEVSRGFPIHRFVEALRRTGQFNNDIDTTATIIVATIASLPDEITVRGNEPTPTDAANRVRSVSTLTNQVLGLLEMAQDGFLPFVSRIKERFPKQVTCIDELLERLSYPGGVPSSPLARVFNEYYYGPSLAGQLHGISPNLGLEKGLIDSEKIMISADTLRCLSSFLPNGKMGIVSGRSRLGTEYTLRDLIRFFRNGPMVFLEDHDANPNASQLIPGKPSPEGLLLAADTMGNCRGILYVGDSMEDLLMIQRANLRRPYFTFCGVASTSGNDSRASVLARRGADAILESVNDLPGLLATLG